jgi:hypothetical protein
VVNEVRVEAHELDVLPLGPGIVKDEFFETLQLLGGDRLLDESIKEFTQLGENR